MAQDQQEDTEFERGSVSSVYRDRTRGRKRRRILAASIACVAFGGFAFMVVYAYNKGRETGTASVAPIIKAAEGPTKVRPEQPGGMQVPNQDKTIYERIAREPPVIQAERLLPPPEQPMPRPPVRSEPAPAAPMVNGANTAPPRPSIPPPIVLTPSPLPMPPAPPVARDPELVPPPRSLRDLAQDVPPPPPAAALAAIAPAAGGEFRVQIAALRSEEDARKEWERIKRANADLFGKLAANYIRVDLGADKGIYYRLQAGPIASAPDAQSLCEQAKGRKLGCVVIKP